MRLWFKRKEPGGSRKPGPRDQAGALSPRGFSSLGVSAYQPILGGRSGPWTLGARQPQGGEGASRADSAPDTASIHVIVEEAP